MKLRAHAKINLFLDVLGIRPDGFHELCTVMQTVGLHDEIQLEAEIAEATSVSVASDCDTVPSDGTNLAARAVFSYAKAWGRPLRARIEIQKRIPVCAGLAGGSADAAAVLRGLNATFGGLTADRLLEIAAEIGSDVPFCLVGGTKLCRGRGERMSDFTIPRDHHVVLINSGERVLTREAFRRLDETPRREEKHDRFAAFCEAPLLHPYNRFEEVILPDCPIARGLKESLLHLGADCAAMSGSGATVFGIFQDVTSALRAAKRLNGTYSEFVF